MNDMELLRELAQQTPLPAPAELEAARARLVAAITSDPAAGRLAAGSEVTVDQPGPPGGPRRRGLLLPSRWRRPSSSCTGAPSAPSYN